MQSIGQLVLYSAESDCSLGYEAFRNLIKLYDAPLKIMKRPKPENIFRQACSSFKYEKDFLIGADTVSYRFFMKDDGFSKNIVSRSLYVQKQLGNSSTTQSYGHVEFDKKTKEIHYRMDEEYDPPWLQDGIQKMKDHIQEYMKVNAETLYSLPLRESIRNAIEGPLHGIPMKDNGGGVYFVPNATVIELSAIEGVASSIPGITVDTLEVIDLNSWLIGMRLSDRFQIFKIEIEGLISELESLLDSGDPMPAKRFTEIQELIDYGLDMLKSYEPITNMVNAIICHYEAYSKDLDALLQKVNTDG